MLDTFLIMPNPFSDDSGVSVIVGALLLILIVVIAAAGLAMIVSQAEKQQADKQALESAIKNENVKIIAIKPVYDTTIGSPTFGQLLKIDATLQNLNIDDVKIGAISLNDIYAKEYHSDGDHELSDPATKWLTIPPSKSVVVELGINSTDFNTPPVIQNSDNIKIQVSTSYYNFFDRTFKPPVAIIKFNVESENLGQIQRDYMILDGSGSSSDSGQIVSYRWTIEDHGYIPNTYSYNGKVIRLNPQSVGPFWIKLTVTDDSGLQGVTDYTIIPSDPSFDPPANLDVTLDSLNNKIIAKLTSLNSNPIENYVINFLPTFGSVTVGPISMITGADGKAYTIYNGSGTVHISAGGLSKETAI